MSDLPPDDDLLAAEYVLGGVDLPTRLALQARIKTDAAFADLVQAWENRLSGLNDDFAEAPAPNLLPLIEARLFPRPERVKRNWFTALIGLGLSSAAILALAAFVFFSQAKPDYLASLAAENSPLRYEAVISGHELTLTRSAGDTSDAEHSYELWLIKGDAAPVSLGLIIGQTASFTLPDAGAGIVLAVSLEPKGGSPTGAPTGPVIAAGSMAPAKKI